MKNKITTLILVMLCSLASMAQVGIGTNSPNANAALDVVSTTQGILLPRMTTAQRNAISSPAEGLTIFNTTTNAMQTNTGTTTSPSWENWYDGGAQLGSTYTAYYTGVTSGDIFSNNTTCQSKLISAQGCDGLRTVTGASSTVYDLVDINGQCWMTTNLNEVPSAYSTASGGSGSGAAWRTNSPGNVGYWGYYNTTATSGASGWATTVPAAGEGLLYQWSAAMNGSTTERAQGVCPTGFHIPSDCEWMYLEHGQGMSISQQTTNNAWRSSTGEGNKLRSAGTGATNSSGFTALLAGNRDTNGTFNNRGTFGFWWSSSEASATSAQFRYLFSSQAGVFRTSGNKAFGLSVRCLKD
jgi:uncharacterized protein (TIGR02145 family)